LREAKGSSKLRHEELTHWRVVRRRNLNGLERRYETGGIKKRIAARLELGRWKEVSLAGKSQGRNDEVRKERERNHSRSGEKRSSTNLQRGKTPPGGGRENYKREPFRDRQRQIAEEQRLHGG